MSSRAEFQCTAFAPSILGLFWVGRLDEPPQPWPPRLYYSCNCRTPGQRKGGNGDSGSNSIDRTAHIVRLGVVSCTGD